MKILRTIGIVLGLLMAGSAISHSQDAEKIRAMMAELEKLSKVAEKKEIQEKNLDDPAYIKKSIRDLQRAQICLEDPTSDNNEFVKPQVQKNIDYTWIITAAVLVFFMQVGFCMLEMGLVRSKNCINVAMKNVLDFSAVAVSYLLFGFTFMYGAGEGDSSWIGSDNFQLWSLDGDHPVWVFWFFQVVFAATCCTIASGAMAERTKFVGYLIYTVILSGLIYPIFGHWAWGSQAGAFGFGGKEGWLEAFGFHDFAGSTVIHGIGGATALAGIIILGARTGRFGKNGEPRYIPGHSLPLAAFGVLILWVGWFGFNAGSNLEGSSQLGRLCVNTAVAGAMGCLSGLVMFWVLRGIPNVLVALNGILGGLVAVTASCDVVNPIGALIIGAIAGVIATSGAILLEKARLDDVAGAVPVHLFNGIWGTLAVALLHEDGVNLNQLGIQAFGTLAICIGAFAVALVLFKVIDIFIGLRADEDDQDDGLDFAEHSANAYPDFQTTEH